MKKTNASQFRVSYPGDTNKEDASLVGCIINFEAFLRRNQALTQYDYKNKIYSGNCLYVASTCIFKNLASIFESVISTYTRPCRDA